MIAAGRLEPSSMITRRIPLAETPPRSPAWPKTPATTSRSWSRSAGERGRRRTLVVAMPHMGVSVEEGTVIEWLVAVGDEVAAERGRSARSLPTRSTPRSSAPADGVLAKIVAAGGRDGRRWRADRRARGRGAAGPSVTTPRTPTQRGEAAADASEGDGASRSVSGESSPTALSSSGCLLRNCTERRARGASSGGTGRVREVRSEEGGGGGAELRRRRVGGEGARRHRSRGGWRRATESISRACVGPGVAGGFARPTSSRPSPRRAASSEDSTARRPLTRGASSTGPELPPGYDDVPHEVVETTRVRRAIAEHMIRSRQTAAHMTTEVDVDLGAR